MLQQSIHCSAMRNNNWFPILIARPIYTPRIIGDCAIHDCWSSNWYKAGGNALAFVCSCAQNYAGDDRSKPDHCCNAHLRPAKRRSALYTLRRKLTPIRSASEIVLSGPMWQSAESKPQFEQNPVEGPVDVPFMQVPVVLQNPQFGCAVQLSQPVQVRQGSNGAVG